MIVEDGRENGRDGRVDGSAVDYVSGSSWLYCESEAERLKQVTNILSCSIT
jgi:hypothetical protein